LRGGSVEPTKLGTTKRAIKVERVESLWRSKRFYIALLLFFNLFINYMDRTSLSIAIPVIAAEFHWNPGTVGIVLSSFMWTYALCLIPWGWISDRLGPRKVNGLSVSLWSVAAMATGAAAGFGTMLAAMLVLGVGEAASLPTAGKVVRQWFPIRERGLATAIFNAGTFAGPALSAPLIAWIVIRIGWRLSFVVIGAVGLVWVFLWLTLFYPPAECSWLAEEERDYVLAETDSSAPAAPSTNNVPLLLKRKTMWGLLLTQGCCAYSNVLFLSWLPSYLIQSRHMHLMKAGWFTSIPYLIAAVLGIFIGKLSDSLLTGTAAKQGKRRTILVVFILLASSVFLVNVVSNEYVVLVLIAMSLVCISSALTLNIAMTSDLVWQHNLIGTALGILITGGITFGMLAPMITGYIVKETGSFDKAFYVAGTLLVMGAIISLTMTRRPISFDAIAETASAEPARC
jgi:ACS family glucarate transporter-like MFS transporter